MLKLLRTHRTTAHCGANHQSWDPKAKLTELRIIVAARGWRNVIIEAPMFVIGDNEERTLPLRTRRHGLIDAADKGLAKVDVVAWVVVVKAKVWVDDGEVRKRPIFCIVKKLVK